MIRVTIPKGEFYDESTNTFLYTDEVTLTLEHSLISISEWESKWHKSFIQTTIDGMSYEEDRDYVRCMTINPKNVNPLVYDNIPDYLIKKIKDYIENPMTATTFKGESHKSNGHRVITSEVIYYQMSELNIPFSCEKWHLNRLLTLIRVCYLNRTPQKKMSKKDLLSSNYALNQARRSRYNTRG